MVTKRDINILQSLAIDHSIIFGTSVKSMATARTNQKLGMRSMVPPTKSQPSWIDDLISDNRKLGVPCPYL